MNDYLEVDEKGRVSKLVTPALPEKLNLSKEPEVKPATYDWKQDQLQSKNHPIKFEKGMHIRLRCKKAGCPGSIEGDPNTLLNKPDYKYVIKCSECKGEFSSGCKLMIQKDQCRGIVDFFKMLFNNDFRMDVELFYPEGYKAPEAPSSLVNKKNDSQTVMEALYG